MATSQKRRSSSKRSSSSKGGKTSSTSSKTSARNASNKQEEADRYRQAAEDALQQLDWTIGYLHGIHKTSISKALAQNRSYIRRNLMGEPDEGLPDQETDET